MDKNMSTILTDKDKYCIKHFCNDLDNEDLNNPKFLEAIKCYMKEYAAIPRCEYCGCKEYCEMEIECTECKEDICAYMNSNKCLKCYKL